MAEWDDAGLLRQWLPAYRVDVRACLGPLRRGASDPAMVLDAQGAWRVSQTPEGAATMRVTRHGSGVEARAWGEGARWALDQLPRLLGDDDDPSQLDPRGHSLVEFAAARYEDFRLGATDLVWESLAPAILEQKVTGKQARQAWSWMVTRYGQPAPGPAPSHMRVPPTPEICRAIPSWEWHEAGVDPARSGTLVQIAAVADRFEGLDSVTADTRMRSRPGVGVWTSAEVRQRAHGDPDAISVGDYHLASFIGSALAGGPVDDAGMLELLEPWAGQRQRVVRILALTIGKTERRGPRATITDHRRR